jgi:DMSO reductase anchor subunit
LHPALSVILFTTASGAGYGLLFWLGVLGALGILPADRLFGLAAFGLALAAITGGLLSSTFHLGHPERAWRSFSQWRSSWLSREGIVSVATYVPAGLFALGWVWLGRNDGPWAACGLLAALGALATVLCTAMIYRSLKPIQRWSNGWVLPNYVALAAMSGALWLAALAAPFGLDARPVWWIAAVAVPVAALLKLGYWRFIGRTAGASTAESATGLGAIGAVRLFEAPHTSENYLMKEMGFQIARKHAARLHRIAVLTAFVLPFLLLLLAFAAGGWPRLAALALAAPLATFGILVERWLFFAEARHTVMLYYGASRA